MGGEHGVGEDDEEADAVVGLDGRGDACEGVEEGAAWSSDDGKVGVDFVEGVAEVVVGEVVLEGEDVQTKSAGTGDDWSEEVSADHGVGAVCADDGAACCGQAVGEGKGDRGVGVVVDRFHGVGVL